MNFETLKSEFREYLKQNAKKKKIKYKLNDSQKSIFLYSKEFKSYLEDKLDIDISDLTKSAKDLSKFELIDGILVNKDLKDDDEEVELSDFDEIELDDPEILVAILNDLLQDEDFKKVLDRNEDGQIDEDELNDFYGSIKENDEDKKSISLEDIIGAVSDIGNGEFKFSDEIEKEKELQAAQLSHGGSSGSISSSGSSPITNKKQEANGDITKMSDDELKSELETQETELGNAQDELVENQTSLSAVLDGSDPELQQAQSNIDSAYDEYQKALKEADKELSDKVNDKKEETDAKRKEIFEKESAISQQQTVIQICQASYDGAQSTISNLKSILSNLQSAQSGADESQKTELSAQISEIETQIEQAQAEVDEAKSQLDEAQDEYDNLTKEKETLDEELTVLESEADELEKEVIEKYPQIEEQCQAYNNAQEEYDTLKETKAQSLSSEVNASIKKVADINAKIVEIQNLINEKEYSPNTAGEQAAEFAKEFMGYNDSDGSADIFTKEKNTTSSATPWCAAFVSYVLKNSGAWDNVASWYKECPNQWLCDTVYSSAKENNAIIDASDAQAGDIVVFNRGGSITHAGLVYKIDDDGTLYTIEGNTGNGVVASHSYNLNDKQLIICKTTV